MQIIKKFDKQANYIFIAAFLIHLVIMCVEFGAWSVPFRGRLLQLAFGLCGIKILMTYYEKYEWILMVVLGAVGIMSYWVTKEKYVLYVVVLIFAAKSVDMKVLIRMILYATLVAMFVIVALSLCGIGGPISLTREFRPGTIATRYCFGFYHPNNMHGTVWYIISLALIIYKDKLNWKVYIILSIANIALFLLTDSKAGFAVAQIVIIGGLIYRYANKYIFEKKWIYILGVVFLFTVIALTILAGTINNWHGYGPILSRIDGALSGRMGMVYGYARFRWWRMWHGYHKEGEYFVDNGFAALGNNYGFVVWGLYLCFILYLIYKAYKLKDGILLVIIITSIGYIFMENSYMLNDAYLLKNLLYIVFMMIVGKEKIEDSVYENSNVRT